MSIKVRGINFTMVMLALLLLVDPGLAFFRHLCHGQVGVGRVDPLMAPGKAAQHVHNIQGASNFGIDADYDQLQASNCTSCSVKQDKSAYWSPLMYFQHENGTYQVVPTAGGYTVYYFVEPHNMNGKSVSVTPFPRGFRMITGVAPKRKFYGPTPDPLLAFWQDSDRTQQSLMEKSIGFLCLHYQDGAPPEPALQRHFMPDRDLISTCDGGIRMELQFPSCWNGKDVDGVNHTSHVAYPYMLRDGDCPPGYPKVLPTLLYEIIYNTFVFKGVPGQFVFAHGDATGFGFHGDFMNGWDDGVLQQIIDQCQAGFGLQEQCKPLQIKPDSEITSCKMETPEVIQNEAVDFVDELPGGCKVVPNLDWSPDCGNDKAAASSPVSSSAQTATSGPPASGPEPSTVATSAALPSSTTSSSLPANTTSAATPPDTTSAPSPTSKASIDLTSYTTVTTVNGTVYNLVVVEEVVTTTIVSVVGGADPTPGATPAGGAKRYLHSHTSEIKTVSHGHGGHKRGKRRDRL